ncbi:DUF5677 domain-containing protein [uncultured Pseudodesulfovibrio sp.]|uniref:DUF5677 domain-containing protein n=1 Tax=uncultured Pseudodesulfovibrio sp. TaxID=2035858 RepID=UPI00374A5B9A
MSSILKAFKKDLTKVKKALDRLDLRRSELTFDNSNEQHYVLHGLYCSLLEYTYTSITLALNHHTAVQAHVIRSYLECYAYFENLLKDEDYLLQIKFNTCTQDIRTLTEAIKFEMGDIEKKRELVDKWTEDQRALSKIGVRKQTIEDRFKNADMVFQYDGLYRSLSAHVHNGISAIETRHIHEEAGQLIHSVKKKQSTGDSIREAISYVKILFFGIILATDNLRLFLSTDETKEYLFLKEKCLDVHQRLTNYTR